MSVSHQPDEAISLAAAEADQRSVSSSPLPSLAELLQADDPAPRNDGAADIASVTPTFQRRDTPHPSADTSDHPAAKATDGASEPMVPGTAVSNSVDAEPPSRLKWSNGDDLDVELLRQVLYLNPFSSSYEKKGDGWEKVAENLHGFAIRHSDDSVRRFAKFLLGGGAKVRSRATILMKRWRAAGEGQNPTAMPGCEADSEYYHLLQEVRDMEVKAKALIAKTASERKEKTEILKMRDEQARRLRDASMMGMTRSRSLEDGSVESDDDAETTDRDGVAPPPRKKQKTTKTPKRASPKREDPTVAALKGTELTH